MDSRMHVPFLAQDSEAYAAMKLLNTYNQFASLEMFYLRQTMVGLLRFISSVLRFGKMLNAAKNLWQQTLKGAQTPGDPHTYTYILRRYDKTLLAPT